MSLRVFLPYLFVTLAGSCLATAQTAHPVYSFQQAQGTLKKYCLSCHQEKAAAGGFRVPKLLSQNSLVEQPQAWTKLLARVRNGEMPPKGAPAPDMESRDQFVSWADYQLRTAACADGISPGIAPLKRLNRNEYAATVRDLLNIHINAGRGLPADGAGGEGFDNAAETLFISPIHAEKYLEAAKIGIEYGLKDPKSRAKFMIAEPNDTTSPEQAARKILEAFIPRAFRRPATEAELTKYLGLFARAQKQNESFDDSVGYALQAILISPNFLFRIEEPNPGPEPRLLDDYALATRLSYFLWGSMPDDELLALAAKGTLQEPDVLKAQLARMLKDVKSLEFAEHFVEQWLNTRELGRDIKPDAKLFPAYYDAEIEAGIRYELILFFQELLASDLSLLNLIDSKFTILTNKLAKHYKIDLKGLKQQPKKYDLPENTHRGGLLGMAAVLAVSSYPQRTSPVLRGKWILEAMLGTPPPPPPPNVPQLKEEHGEGVLAQTLRERLMQHRANPACATCHNRIDPLGFALENYDVLGEWRSEQAGKPIDAKGELLDGTTFDGVDGLKKVLLERKGLVMRNLTTKMLGYALGRGLTLEEYCTVDHIVAELEKTNYSAQTLVREIVLSVPFRYQSGSIPAKSVVSRAGLN